MESVGRVADGELILAQAIRMDGKPSARTFRIRRAPDGAWVGSLSDAAGPVRATVAGNVMRLSYRMKRAGMRMNQVLALQPGGRVALNSATVTLLGIPVAGMVLFTFAYSAALGGLAGILVAPVLFVSVGMGALISLKAFAANIIGGFGNIPGAIVGGLALGVVETFGAAYISVPYKDALAFAVLLAFLLVRPQGLFGEKIAEKA